jgi:ribosomal protein S18 acetylase RimI-like enzyme
MSDIGPVAGRSTVTQNDDVLHVRIHTLGAVPQEVRRFIEGHPLIRGDEVITEQMALALSEPHRHSGFVVEMIGPPIGMEVRAETRAIGVAVLADASISEPSSSVDRPDKWVLETVAPADDAETHKRLLNIVSSLIKKDQRYATLLWRPPSDHLVTHGLPVGWTLQRAVYQLRAPLPLAGRSDVLPPGVTIEFVDLLAHEATLQEVIEVNAAAFAAHPDQGTRDVASFRSALAAPWISHTCVAYHDDRVIAFAWMKCASARPTELYVVGVHPDHAGLGLGRTMVTVGFDHAMALHGAREAMLYVGADNAAAQRLYQSMGFEHVRSQEVAVRNLSPRRKSGQRWVRSVPAWLW